MTNENSTSSNNLPAPGEERTYLVSSSHDDGPGPIGLDSDDVTGFLGRRWRSILVLSVLVFGAVAGATYLLPKTYESSATFLIEDADNRDQGEALAVLDRVRSGRTAETEMELLRGRRVIVPVVEKLNLHASLEIDGDRADARQAFPLFDVSSDAEPGEYSIAPGRDGQFDVTPVDSAKVLARGAPGDSVSFRGVHLRLPDLASLPRATLTVTPFTEAVESVRSRIEVGVPAVQASIVEVTCTGGTADGAAAMCRELVDSYLAFRSRIQRAEAEVAATFLEDQVERVRQQLASAEESLQAYQEQTRSVALEERASQEVRQHAGLRAEREQLRAERDALNSLIEDIRQGEARSGDFRRLASFPTFLRSENNVVSSLVGNLVQLENRRSDLAVKRTEQNPELAALDLRIAEIEAQLLDAAESYRNSLTAQINSLERSLATAGQSLASIPERQVRSARLQRRVSVLEDLYRHLQTRHQEATVAKAVNLPNVQLVDRPSVPFAPTSPNVPLNLALGLVLGLTTGVLGGFWREYNDDTLRSRGSVEDETGIPVLTMVPRLKKGRRIPAIADANGQKVLPAPSISETGPPRPEVVAAESFRTLALELEAFVPPLGSVAITSSTRGEGKTLTASNLAAEYARLGHRTLLIDADMRAGSIGPRFQLNGDGEGLYDLLLDELLEEGRDPAVAIRSVEVEEGRALDVLPAGRSNGKTSVLRTSVLRRLLDRVRDRYDLVIVDTPPLNMLSDAAQVARVVDGVVVVARGGTTQRDGLDLTLQRLKRLEVRLVGLVLNDVEIPDYYTRYSGVHADDE